MEDNCTLNKPDAEAWPQDVKQTQELCEFCRNHGLWQPASKRQIAGKFDYGTIRELLDRRDCPFCILVLHLLPLSSVTAAMHTGSIAEAGGNEDRTAVGWSPDISRIFVWFASHYRGRAVKVSSSILAAPDSLPMARNVSLDSSALDFGLAQGWLQDCEHSHPDSTLSEVIPDPKLTDFLLLDVIDGCVVQANPTATRFLALSYVWGGVQQVQNTKDIRPQLAEKGCLTRIKLPQLIQDAMLFVRRLSERYLWVDSLCIMQDEPSHKHEQIQNMDFIYSRALATIIAFTSDNANDSLPGVRPATRRSISPKVAIEGETWEVEPASLNALSLDCTYERRGWCMQERLLSQRCFFFTDHQLCYTCHLGTSHSTLHKDTYQTSVDLKHADFGNGHFLKAFQENRLAWPNFVNLLRTFTERAVSFPEDRLNAISGFLSVLHTVFGLDFVCGLPKQDLHRALLWSPWVPWHRNQCYPSWSWAGCTERVDYLWDEAWGAVGSSCEAHLKPRIDMIAPTYSPLYPSLPVGMLSFVAARVECQRFGIDRKTSLWPRISCCLDDTIVQCGEFKGYFSKGKESCKRHDCSLILLSRSKERDVLEWFPQERFPLRPWCFFNVMLVEHKGEYAERIHLGWIHEDAWNQAGPEETHIQLV